jgi:two-component system, NarL family, invasion response regulator UvrY
LIKTVDGPTQEKLRILILDDHLVVRQAIKQIVLDERFDPLEFGESTGGSEGLDLALGRPWDLVIGREGLDVLTELKRIRPDQLILVLTLRSIESQIEVANNPAGSVQSSQVEQAVNPSPPWRHRRTCWRPPSHESLSNREGEVLRLLGLGRTLKEIAGALALSETTIRTSRSRILTKLGFSTPAELVRYAVNEPLGQLKAAGALPSGTSL